MQTEPVDGFVQMAGDRDLVKPLLQHFQAKARLLTVTVSATRVVFGFLGTISLGLAIAYYGLLNDVIGAGQFCIAAWFVLGLLALISAMWVSVYSAARTKARLPATWGEFARLLSPETELLELETSVLRDWCLTCESMTAAVARRWVLLKVAGAALSVAMVCYVICDQSLG